LVRSSQPQAYVSVHHTAWPEVEPHRLDDRLLDEMALAKQVCSLGLGARNAAGLKVRQPLSRVLAFAGSQSSLSPELVETVKDELNVKALEFVKDAARLVSYRILPDNKLLGPRFGARFPALRSALAALDPSVVAAAVQAGESLSLIVDGEAVTLAPQEIVVQTQPLEGLAVAADKLATVAVDTVITPELRAEGLAREVVRRIQDLRKKADFKIEDRITVFYVTEAEELAALLPLWAAYIQAETLATHLVTSLPEAAAVVETQNVDGMLLTLGVKR
jgi:isoleucyl-tRNA synthetase